MSSAPDKISFYDYTLNKLRNGTHPNTVLQNEFNHFGEEGFSIITMKISDSHQSTQDLEIIKNPLKETDYSQPNTSKPIFMAPENYLTY